MKFSPVKHLIPRIFIAAACIPALAFAQPANVDPKADQVLRVMTTYLSGLKTFSAKTENTIEVVTPEGQKIQYSSPAMMTVSRPNKLVAERPGDIVSQAFYYDGKTLTLFDPDTKNYATVQAPDTLDAMLDFAGNKFDLIMPGADLVDSRAYELLMDGVTSGRYVGMSVIDGFRCHHLAYRSADVDWQLWVREGKRAFPCRYVITSRDVAGGPQFSMQLVKFDASPKVSDAKFRFTPPAGAKKIEFLPVSGSR